MITYRLIDGHWLIDRDDIWVNYPNDDFMLVVCCVCNKAIRGVKGKPGISHGYCPDCFKKEMEKLNEE